MHNFQMDLTVRWTHLPCIYYHLRPTIHSLQPSEQIPTRATPSVATQGLVLIIPDPTVNLVGCSTHKLLSAQLMFRVKAGHCQKSQILSASVSKIIKLSQNGYILMSPNLEKSKYEVHSLVTIIDSHKGIIMQRQTNNYMSFLWP